MSDNIARFPVSLLDLVSYFNGTNRCKDPNCRCHLAMANHSHLVESSPIVRVPVTQKHAVAILSGKFVCEDKNCKCHKSSAYIGDAFYESINKLVWKLANKYAITCKLDDVKDLGGICFNRIVKMLHKYDPKYEFSTWVWTVCENILRHQCEKTKRYIDVFQPVDDDTNLIGKKEGDSFLFAEMVSAIDDLKEEFPAWEGFLTALFGNTKEAGYCMPDAVCIAKSARVAGRSYNEVHLFMKEVVRPFFSERFGL
jgi:hypothetical protein